MTVQNNSESRSDTEIFTYRERFSNRQVFIFSNAGLCFVLSALVCLAGLGWHLIRASEHAYQPYMATIGDHLPASEILTLAMFDHYFTVFFTPIMLFLCAVFSAAIGVLLLRAAGAANKDVIPRQDYELISSMLITQNEKGIDHYIRLSSLTGITGVFTKVGLTGLPLATISLTIFFTLMSIWGDQFFDLAKLTLGAFIGSYVQKQAAVSQQEKPASQRGS